MTLNQITGYPFVIILVECFDGLLHLCSISMNGKITELNGSKIILSWLLPLEAPFHFRQYQIRVHVGNDLPAIIHCYSDECPAPNTCHSCSVMHAKRMSTPRSPSPGSGKPVPRTGIKIICFQYISIVY